ncbi:MAG TPA: potassium transporter TrkG [Clostridia bacterium]|nr:potassium transporter TrkG [Clostridia bacterium]
MHTKIVLFMTGGLIAFGAVFFLLVEWVNPETLADPSLSPWMRPIAALFQSVTLRTAGFNSIDQSAMTDASKMMSILMMFVGASPASTGGGLKTTTAFTLVLMAISTVQGREDHVAFGKRLPHPLVLRALALALISVGVAIVGIMTITLIEYGFVRHESELDFLEIAFEVLSALGTVGLSCNLTTRLSSGSCLLLMGFMFAGRVGPLTLTLALARRQKKGEKSIRYPEERIMIG